MTSKLVCGKCRKNISKTSYKIGCTGLCNQWYHSECSGLSESEINDLSKRQIVYLCDTCKTTTIPSNEYDLDAAFYDAMDNNSNEKKVDVQILTYIMKQKDIIIKELRNKIEILNDHIEVLKGSMNEKEIHIKQQKQSVNMSNKNHEKVPPAANKKQWVAKNDKGSSTSNINTSSDSVATVPKVTENLLIDKNQVSCAIHEAKANIICRDYIELGNHENKDEGIPYKRQEPRKRRAAQRKYGEAEDETKEENGFEGKDTRKLWLFISQVKDHVTEETIKKYLAQKGDTEAYVKEIDAYNKIQNNKRFKIGLSWTLKQQATEGIFWPKGVAYARFNFGKEERYLNRLKTQQEIGSENFQFGQTHPTTT